MPTGRRPFVAGNWKMQTDRAGAVRLASDVARECAAAEGRVEMAVCPPFVYIDAVGQALRSAGSGVALGAQDAYDAPNGAFTGEISTAMLADLSVRHVIVGHSERRHVIGEGDDVVRRKARAVLDAGLSCILCVGETIEQRRAGETDAVNGRQVRAALAGVPAMLLSRVTIAYEPVWAIGTGQTATPDDAQDAHAKIRALLMELHGPSVADAVRIQYGGSVKVENARELFAQPDVDGGLIGGASLRAVDFAKIVSAAAEGG